MRETEFNLVLKGIWKICTICIMACALIAPNAFTAAAEMPPEAENKEVYMEDVLAMAVYDLYTNLPYGNTLPDDFKTRSDFFRLYDDYGQVVAKYMCFSNGSYIVVNNNTENPFIVEHGLHGFELLYRVLADNPGKKLVYDGPGMIRARDFENESDDDVTVPKENYHTMFPDADKPDKKWADRLSECRETVLDADGNINEEWIRKMQTMFFVRRQYVICLDRLPDEKGLSDWTAALLKGAKASKVIRGFFHSPEYNNRAYMEALYVMHLYMTFLDRRGEPLGVEKWTTALLYGATRDQVFRGFAKSKEFAMYCEKNGLVP